MFKRSPWRPVLAFVIVSLTIFLFASYIANHPEVRNQLSQTSFGVLAFLLFLYILFIGALSLVINATTRLCRSRIPQGESILLTMYSSVINFFGPLQSGPALRAVYLKQKHAIKIKDYTLASFVYYFFYALFSVILLFSGLLGWWLLLLIPLLLFIAWVLKDKHRSKINALDLSAWPFMAVATLIQVGLLILIFWVELSTVSPGVEFSQVAIYTGAANLALFVSFTPGAIGFRESFLIFSQRLHGIDSSTIVAANTIDRAVYIVLLGILAIAITAAHARNRFAIKNEDDVTD